MSTDSSELTFVRCPSCRSLVPAVSTRCRMCGATLDAAAKPDESEEERKKPGRVRQKTMTQSQSELMQAAGQIRSEMASEAVAPEDDFAASDEDIGGEPDSDNESFDNPLGQYLDEDQADSGEANGNGSAAPPMSAFLDDEPEAAEPMQSAPPAAMQPEIEPEPVVAPPPPAREEQKPRVTVQSGGRPPGRTSGLSFGKPKEEKPAARFEEKQGRPENDRAARTHEQPNQKREQAPMKREEIKEDYSVSTGRLFGWLISYDSKEGTAIELREGRFFVNSTKLKPSDLVINNKNLSTPHALVAASSGQGLRVQDLMSDGGVYVRRKNSASFQREEGTVNVEHGDWIKFADAEFLVALIPAEK